MASNEAEDGGAEVTAKSTEASTEEEVQEPSAVPRHPGVSSVKLPPHVHDLCRDMFQKTSDYVQGELLGTAEEYLLLEKLNKMTTAKYSDMSSLSRDLTVMMTELNEKYAHLKPYLEQIDQLEENVSALESAAYQLDKYSKKLEAKLRQVDRR